MFFSARTGAGPAFAQDGAVTPVQRNVCSAPCALATSMGSSSRQRTPHKARMKDKTEDILACNPASTSDSTRHRLASRAPEGDARVRALQAALDALAAAAAGFTVATIDPKARSRIGVVRGAAMQTAKGHNTVFRVFN